jgi:hypothetical protein
MSHPKIEKTIFRMIVAFNKTLSNLFFSSVLPVQITCSERNNSKARKKIAMIIQPTFGRASRACMVKFGTILVLLQMIGKVHPLSENRIGEMVKMFLTRDLAMGNKVVSDEIIEQLSRSLFSCTHAIKANDRRTSRTVPASHTNWKLAEVSALDCVSSSQKVPEAQFDYFQSYTIMRQDWYESIQAYLACEQNLDAQALQHATNTPESENQPGKDDSEEATNLPKQSEITTENDSFSPELEHLLFLMEFTPEEKAILTAFGWKNANDLILNVPKNQKTLFSKGVSQLKIFSILKYVNYILNNISEHGATMGKILDLDDLKWCFIMRGEYQNAFEKMEKVPYPAKTIFEPTQDEVQQYMNKISVTLPPLVLFFWMGDDLFASKENANAGGEWCPFVQLDVNNRSPDIDDAFAELRAGFFSESGTKDFNEEYVVFPYKRKYAAIPTALNSGSITAMITKEIPIEGQPNADSFVTGLDMVSNFFKFVVGCTYEEHYPGDLTGLDEDTIKNVKAYHIFARGNVHFARKYKNFATLQNIRELHNDLCNHLLLDIPAHFFLLDKAEGESKIDLESLDSLREDEAFNDLMRRTLLLFKAAFSADIALLDGSHRCVGLKSSVFNLGVNTRPNQTIHSLHSDTDPPRFELSKVSGMATISIVWPTWNQYESHDCNWMVSSYFRQRNISSDFRIVYPKIE